MRTIEQIDLSLIIFLSATEWSFCDCDIYAAQWTQDRTRMMQARPVPNQLDGDVIVRAIKAQKVLANRFIMAEVIRIHLTERFEASAAKNMCINTVLTPIQGMRRKETKRVSVKVITIEGAEGDGIGSFIFKVDGRLGARDSRDADAYRICFPMVFNRREGRWKCEDPSIRIAIKFIPLTKADIAAKGDATLTSMFLDQLFC